MNNFFISHTPKKSQIIFWLALSLTWAAIYSILGLQQAFASDYVVQDDARHHVFWMRRFLDSELLPNDLIADYFQSIAPWGYTLFYKFFATIGIDPIFLSKVLPIILGMIATVYGFGICFQLLPVPLAGFIGTLLLNQNLWFKDDLSSGTPRAFLYPIFLAFLYYLLKRSCIPSLIVLALLGVFYPQYLLICIGLLLLQLCSWDNGRLRFSSQRRDYLFYGAGIGLALFMILPYVLNSSEFGPVVTAAEARAMPEFWPGGRTKFFTDHFSDYWFCGGRTGMFPREWCQLGFPPPQIFLGVLLPIVLRFPSRFPLAKRVSHQVKLLGQLLVVSFGFFFLAHALLFKLYLPSRYTEHGWRIVMAIAAGIALTVVLDAIFPTRPKPSSSRSRPWQKQGVAIGFTVLISAFIILYPTLEDEFPDVAYEVGEVPRLYQFFAQQPKDSLIASVSREANFLPTFSQRSVLVSKEYAIPLLVGYYQQIRQRVVDLLVAQYSTNEADVQAFIQKYGVDFWLLDRSAFTPNYLASDSWLQQYQPVATEALTTLQQGKIPVVETMMEHCKVFQTEEVVVLEANCILEKRHGQ